MDDYLVKIPEILKFPILLLASFQNISFVFGNYYFSNTQHNDFKLFFMGMTKFTRPYTIFPKKFSAFSFIIPFTLIIIQEMIGIYLFIIHLKNKKCKKVKDIFKDLNRSSQILIQFFSYIQQLSYYLLIIPLLEMSIQSIEFYQDVENFDFIGFAFGLVSLFLTLENFLFYQICVQQSIHIKVKNFNNLKQCFNHYLNPIFSFILVIITTFEHNNQQLKFLLSSSIIIVKSLFNLYSIFSTFQNTLKRNQIDLFFETYQLSIAIVLLFIELSKFESESKDYETILLLVVTPLSSYIPVILFNSIHQQIMTNSNQNSQLLLYKISNTLESFEKTRSSYIQDNEKITFIVYFKIAHIKNCSLTKCQCNQSPLSFEQILNLYLNDQISLFNQSINKIKHPQIKQFYFLHYLSLIHHLGLSQKALQQSNITVYEESENFSQSATKIFGSKSIQKESSSNSLEKYNSSVQKSQAENKLEERVSIKIENLTIIQKQRLLILQEQIKKTMSIGFGKNRDLNFSDNLEYAVKLFLKSEQSNQQFKHKIVKTLNMKKEFLLRLSQTNQNYSLFNEGKKIVIKMAQLEQQLIHLYLQFPSSKMQALNTFYQSEVMNNYFSAYKLANSTSVSDEKLYKMQTQMNFDLFSNKLDYLIIGFDERSHKLQIRNSSNTIHNFFGISQEKFKGIKSLDHIIPSNFEQTHQKLVQQFLQQGISKFFRQINQNYCRYQQKFIKLIDFFYDLNASNLDDLTFACFLKDVEFQSAYLFCSTELRVDNITKNLAQKLGYPEICNKQLLELLKKAPISKIFPKFQTSQQQFSKFSLNQNNQNENEFDQDLSEYQTQMFMPNQDSLLKKSKDIWDEDLCQFTVDVVYHIRKLKQDFNSNFIIIEVREAKKYSFGLGTPQPTEFSPTTKFSQEEINEFEKEIDEYEEYEEMNINYPRALQLDFSDDKNKYQMNLDNISEKEFRFAKKLLDINQSQAYPNFPNVSLISPKDPKARLVEEQNSNIFSQSLDNKDNGQFQKDLKLFNLKNNNCCVQQKFFSAFENQADSQFAENLVEQEENEANKEQNLQVKIERFQGNNIDKELQEVIQMQMQLEKKNEEVIQIDDVGSQVSSIAAFKKSKYSKKYELVQQLIESNKFSNYYYQLRFLLFIFLLVFSIFSIIEIIFSQDDFNRFLQELDMIQIKSKITAPIDNYIVAQNAVMNYAILNLIGLMSKENANIKLLYSQNDIYYNYQDLKESFTTQLTNKYLSQFIYDVNFTVIMSEQDHTSTHSMSVREAINLSLEAAYQFVLLDYQNIFTSLDSTSGFFVYLFGNYEVFYKQLSAVNQEILKYSNNRSLQVGNKLFILMIPTIIIGFILLILIIKYHHRYLSQYDQVIRLFSTLETVWLQRDIDRFQGITNLVIKDSDVLFKYKFDIDLKEQFLKAEEIRKEKIIQNQKSQKQKSKSAILNFNQNSKKLPSLIFYSVIYIICFSLCFMSTSFGDSYVKQYSDTANFFNTLCDISIASTGVFSQRQTIYAIESTASSAFFFLKSSQFFIDVFNEHIQQIENFLNLMAQFNPQNLITSNIFIEKMQSLMSSDICEFLPSYKIQSAQIHCDAVYGGVVRRGLTATLSTVRSQLLNEFQTSKNFTIQIYSLNEELETGLISYDAISNVKEQFQTELVNFTQNLIQSIKIINICSIVIYFLSIIIFYTTITKIYKDEFRQVLKFILLIPQTSLFLDGQFDRNLKQLITKNDLI